jgi:hypothetical protein
LYKAEQTDVLRQLDKAQEMILYENKLIQLVFEEIDFAVQENSSKQNKRQLIELFLS